MGYPAYTQYSQHSTHKEIPLYPQIPLESPLAGGSRSSHQSHAYPIRRSREMQNPTLVYPDQGYSQQNFCYSQYPHEQYQHSSSSQYGVAASSSSYMETPPPGYEQSLRPESSRIRSSSRGLSPGGSYTSSLSSNSSLCAPSLQFTGKLTKPIAIPATRATLGSPFLRAYAPVLQYFDISRDVFLQFLDGLNRAAVASPPIQVLGLAGNIVSMVPLHTAQIVGGAVNTAAKIGTVAVSKGRVEAHLREANRDIFGPKGLKAEIAKLSALAVMAKMPILGPDGKVDKNLPLLQDLEDDTLTLPAQHRRVQALEKWIEKLEVLDLPTAEQSSNPISKMHASASERQRRKEEEKLVKDRSKAEKDWKKDSKKLEREYNKKMRELERDENRARKKGDEEKLDKIGDKMDRVQEKFGTKMNGGIGGNKAEEKLLRKIYFLTVTNAYE